MPIVLLGVLGFWGFGVQHFDSSANSRNTESLFLHFPYHLGNIPNRTVRQLFESTIPTPPDGPPIHQMTNNVGTILPTFSLTIARSCPPNLGKRVAPTYVTFDNTNTHKPTNNNHDNDHIRIADTTLLTTTKNTNLELL